MSTFLLVNPERKVSSIAILISFRGKKYKMTTGESIPVKMWNSSKKRSKVTADFQEGNDINEILDKWEDAGRKTVMHFKQFFNPPTTVEFREYISTVYFNDDINKPKIDYFVDYIDIYIERYKRIKDHNTIKNYITTKKKLMDYEKYSKTKLTFNNIDIKFYNNFKVWFYAQNYSDNYFGTVIKNIKNFYSEAKQVDKLHDNDEINHKDFVTVKKTSGNIYLTEEELYKIFKLEINEKLIKEYYPDLNEKMIIKKINSLNIVRDRFLLGAYTGFRYSDFSKIEEINVGEYISIIAKKTKKKAVVPIHPIVKSIIENGFDYSLVISQQKINKRIKEIAFLAGIDDECVVYKHTGGKVEHEVKKKYDLITSHTARRSFATNAYKAGVDTISIMKITGHSKQSEFMNYIKVNEEENAQLLKDHVFFAGPHSVTK